MYDTKYSNKTAKKVGEQQAKTYVSGSRSVPTEYNQVGSSRTYGNRTSPMGPNKRHKNHLKPRGPFLNGGGNKQVSASYANRTHGNFGTEGVSNKLVEPHSRPPKAK